MERFGNQASSQITLTSGVSASAVTWPISSLGTGAFVIPSDGDFALICEDEIAKVTAVSGLNLTVVRGQESTTAASHAAGTRVYHWLTKRSMDALVQAYSVTFSATGSPQTVTVLGTAHDFDFSVDPPVVQIWDDGSPTRDMIAGSAIRYNPTTGDITITFTENQNGTIIILGRP